MSELNIPQHVHSAMHMSLHMLLSTGSPVRILPLTREFSVIPPTFDRLWPFLRHPQLALPKNLLEFRMVYKGRPLYALSRRGYRKHV